LADIHHQNAVARLRLSISSFIRLKDLASDDALYVELAVRTTGWDGPRLRKLPLAVIGADPALARDPARLTAAGLRAAAGT
jgi:hypothetical protein